LFIAGIFHVKTIYSFPVFAHLMPPFFRGKKAKAWVLPDKSLGFEEIKGKNGYQAWVSRK
jgi:hypothetical protein